MCTMNVQILIHIPRTTHPIAHELETKQKLCTIQFNVYYYGSQTVFEGLETFVVEVVEKK